MNKIYLSFLGFFLFCVSLHAHKEDDYKNPKLSTQVRVISLLSQMTLEEKIGQMDMFALWDLKKFKDNQELIELGIGAWIVPSASPEQYNELQALSEKSRYTTGYGLGSRRADDKPAFTFGHGLSYTNFEYGKPTLNDSIMQQGKDVVVSLDITNTGKVAGYETVFCFVRDEVSSVVTPLQLLKGFEKIWLNAGETKKVTIKIPF